MESSNLPQVGEGTSFSHFSNTAVLQATALFGLCSLFLEMFAI